MFYLSDFKVHPLRDGGINESPDNIKPFSLLFQKNNETKAKLSKYSLANAAKPLVYTASICGIQMVRYGQNDLKHANIFQKLYCVSIVASIILLVVFVKPSNWINATADIPLNIITKTLNCFLTIEFVYSLLVTTFRKNGDCINLFRTLDGIDEHFDLSRKIYKDKFLIALMSSSIPILHITFTVALNQFNIRNLGLYATVFQNILQKSIITFFILNIYIKLVMFNKILLTKMKSRKMNIFKESRIDVILKTMFRELKFIEHTPDEICWFELMQIYDKISDSMQIFNNIFMWPVFIIFNEWFLITLSFICKFLSPTTKNFNMFQSDLYKYTMVNSRQFALTKFGDLLKVERKKTVSILTQILLEQDNDKDYYDQVQTLLNLVEDKRMDFHANVFVVDIPTVMHFCGPAISLTVLMIQYFYTNGMSQ